MLMSASSPNVDLFKSPNKSAYNKQALNLQIADSLRNFFVGAIEPLTDTIAMLIAIHYFQATTSQKSFLAIALHSGLMLGIPLTIFFSKLKSLSIKHIFIVLYFSAGFIVLGNIALGGYLIFLFTIIIVTYVLNGTHPMITPMYSSWHKKNRASRFMLSLYSYIIGSAFISVLVTQAFNLDLASKTHYVFIWLGVMLLFFLAGSVSFKLPKIFFSPEQSINLKSMTQCLKNDKLFIYVLISWFILGVGNLWLLPYRTNLLVEEKFGFNYSIQTTLFILVILPEITRMLFIPLFAFLFDRINFIFLRILLNSFLLFYSLLFFGGNHLWIHVLGMFFFGISKAGSSIAWRLWVNKFAPKKKVGLYMSIHSGLTGLRMISFPFLGLYGLEFLGPATCGYISATLFSVSIVMFIPLLRYGNSKFNQ